MLRPIERKFHYSISYIRYIHKIPCLLPVPIDFNRLPCLDFPCPGIYHTLVIAFPVNIVEPQRKSLHTVKFPE